MLSWANPVPSPAPIPKQVLDERLYVMGGCEDAARGVAGAAVEVLERDGPFLED